MLHNISEISEIAKRLILAAHHSAIIPSFLKPLESVVQIRCN